MNRHTETQMDKKADSGIRRKSFALKDYNNVKKTLTLSHTDPTFNDLENRSFQKTLWEKEKMLVTSIFSFSNNVFFPITEKLHHLSHI